MNEQQQSLAATTGLVSLQCSDRNKYPCAHVGPTLIFRLKCYFFAGLNWILKDCDIINCHRAMICLAMILYSLLHYFRIDKVTG